VVGKSVDVSQQLPHTHQNGHWEKAGHLFGPRLRGGIFCSGNNTKNGIKTTKGAKPRLVVGTHTSSLMESKRKSKRIQPARAEEEEEGP
jgi:hypothetical protein